MSSSRIFKSVPSLLKTSSHRNFGILAPAYQKISDPIQQLFLEKVREYKKRSSGGKLVDPTPEIEQDLKRELTKLAKQYGGEDGADMIKFPDFKFVDPILDPINMDK